MDRKIYILQDVPIEITMPDGSAVQFILEKPNAADNPFYFEMKAEAPSGERFYKDPSRSRQKHYEDYYPVFYLNYSYHRMFTTMLLVAANIALKTPPGFGDTDHYITTDCLLQADSVQKNYQRIPALASQSFESEAKANPIKSGSTQLTFIGRDPLSWEGALNYYFYQRMDSSGYLASGSWNISNNDIVIHK